MSLKRSIAWIDAGGRTRLTTPQTLAGAGSIMTALQNHSNASAFEWWEGTDVLLPRTPVSASFPDVQDIARLTFTTPAGNLVTLALPAPQAAIFLADSVTVDPSTIVDITTAAIGNLCTVAGVAVTAYVAGVRGLLSSGN